MNVLAIGCHPDDVEVTCAGTLIKCIKRGDKVTVCHVCNGSLGHVEIMPDELRKIRIQEAKNAGALAGIEVVTCDIDDLNAYGDNKEQRDILVDIIRNADPDFIITHAPTDYMADHVAVSKLVFDASFAASVPHYVSKVMTPSKVVPIFYMDNDSGINFNPTEYVDITDEFDLKIQMLECHESQLKWIRDHDNIDFTDSVRTIAKFRGYQCGCKYAEAFTQCQVSLKMTTKRLLP